jgi:hypothetical protein
MRLAELCDTSSIPRLPCFVNRARKRLGIVFQHRDVMPATRQHHRGRKTDDAAA